VAMIPILLLSTFWTVMAVIGFLILAATLIWTLGGFGEFVCWILWDLWFGE